MQCPLCGGPLRVEESTRFKCERGHVLEPGDMRRAAGQRVSVALWMAIEALESEAPALRALETLGEPEGDGAGLADRAEEDARILRELASKHIPSSGDRAGAIE